MKFASGDEIDSSHCTVLHHEFFRCEDAFKDFETYATTMILRQQNGETDQEENRYIAYKTYNAYSTFLHHLYEFILGARVREVGNTQNITYEDKDRWLLAETSRILSGRRNAIIKGIAPSWENDLSYYPEKIPPEFPVEFRQYRNKVSGHVTHERSKLSLSEFYSKYHKYIYMLYWNCLIHWSLQRQKQFPDLKEITDFSVMIKERLIN